jgi:hypothetical protein
LRDEREKELLREVSRMYRKRIFFGRRLCCESGFDGAPIDGTHECREIIGSFDTVVQHKSVLEDIHDEERVRSGEVSAIMLIHPNIEESAGFDISGADKPP